MIPRFSPRRGWEFLRREDHAAQLVEFAVALPLLVVFVVGIFDFSGAFTLKQKLTNVARDAARAAASEPINDLCTGCSGVPVSVTDAFYVIDNYLLASQISDCGITPANMVPQPTPTTWEFQVAGSALNGCPSSGLTIFINRGYYFPAVGTTNPPDVTCASQTATGQTAVISTCVGIKYGYQWRFSRAASLLGPTPLLPPTITAVGVAMNEN